MKNTRRIAFSGIISAASVAIIYISTVTELFSFTGCMIAAFAILFMRTEYGVGAAASVYGAVTVLLWLILPDKEIAAIYTFIAGLYPLVKCRFDRLRSVVLRFACKLAAYNCVLAALYFAARAILMVEAEAPWLTVSVLVLANLVFILCDILADRLIILYNVKYRPILLRRGIL